MLSHFHQQELFETMSKNVGDKKKTPHYQDVDGWLLPNQFSPEAFRSALAYIPRPDDLFIVTYPKCGTTWMQTIVSCIFRKGQPFETGLEFFSQCPFLELTGAEGALTMKRPGALKVHLPFHITPYSPEAKYIFVARNPKDCCVSFYKHTENIPVYEFGGGDFDVFFELFIEGKADYGDYFDTLLSWYEHRNDPNVLFVTYEQLQEDIKTNVLKIAQFMGSQYKEALENDDKMLKDVILNSSFKFMKGNFNKQMAEISALPREEILNNPDIPDGLKKLFGGETKVFHDKSSHNFIRKGIVGDWKNFFSPMQNARLMKKYQEKTIGTDIPKLWDRYM
ncbi:hypothetical protein JTE90_001563 [Oedothorax gibbosus]|uniref:Sulfotransferase domain-containing protein n=1 Tax=Oedothorax gibbosus TaxID=931172 RepID=A0AAV6VNM6_9ARAC|nr:hypothetical protein JTE90_001563 [Oedothorax gibbosus]